MSTVTSKVPTIKEFLTMTTVEILKLPMENRQLMEFSKFFLYGIYSSHLSNQHFFKPILALTYFVEKFESSTKRIELYDIVLPILKESLSEVFQSTDVNDMTSFIGMITITVSDTVDSTLDNSMEALQSLVIGALDLLLQLHKLIYERLDMDQTKHLQQNIDSELENSIHNLHVLRSKLIGILTSNDVKCFPVHFSSSDITFVNKLMFILCGMAEFASKTIEAKFSVEVWRCIAILCTTKLPKLVDELIVNQGELNCMEFLLTVVKTCCFCIENSVREICESSEQATEKFHGKIISFLTTVLQRLAGTYPHDKFHGHEHVLNTYLILMRTIRTIAQPNEFLNQNLTVAVENILFLICKSNKFTECFYRASTEAFATELLHFGLEMSKKMTDEDDSEFLQYFMDNEDTNIVCKLLKCSSIGPSSTFSKSLTYKDLIVQLSSLLVKTSKTTNSQIVLRLLINSLLESNNSIRGYIVIDLWSIWVRDLSEVQRYNLILFWSKINDKFSIVQSIPLQSVHVRILLQNLYDNLTDPYKLKLRLNKPIMSNVKLWATLGLHRIPNEINEIKDLHVEIVATYESFVMQRTDSAFYKLIEHLRLLETISPATETTVPDYLINLWKLNFNKQTNKYSPLIIRLIRISISYNKALSNSQHFVILQKLTGIAATTNVKFILKLEILNYLRHIAIKYFTLEYQNDILKLIRQLFNKNFIDSDPIVKEVAFTIYGQVISDAQHENLTADDITDDALLKMELYNFITRNNTSTKTLDEQMEFLAQLSTYSSQHECVEPEISSSDDEGFHSSEIMNVRIKEIIDRMQSDTKELIALHRDNKLTKECCENIRSIREELMLIK